MTFSLYAATVPGFQQILSSVSGFIDKAEAYAQEKGIPAADLIQARLAPDMLPWAYQVKSAVVHSLGAIDGVRRGQFAPDMTPPPETFAALKARVTEALAALAAISPAEIDGFIGRDVFFSIRDYRVDFVAENFLLSFSQPNFYFHATTAYDILRWKGVALGKRDFLGKMRSKA